MPNAQFLIGLILFFGGSLWLIVSIGRARYERLALAQSADNLARSADRRTNSGAHAKPYGHSFRAAARRAHTTTNGDGHADGGTK